MTLVASGGTSPMTDPDGRCFLSAWAATTPFRNVEQKPNLPNWKDSPSPPCSTRAYYPANALFRAGNVPLSGHIVNKCQTPAVLQLNIKGLTASKMNLLNHLPVQYEALVILLQETHCTCSDKLTIPGFALAGSSLAGSMALPCLSMTG